ncbi:hypothetical protein VPH35_031685 [Triticum aestivum]
MAPWPPRASVASSSAASRTVAGSAAGIPHGTARPPASSMSAPRLRGLLRRRIPHGRRLSRRIGSHPPPPQRRCSPRHGRPAPPPPASSLDRILPPASASAHRAMAALPRLLAPPVRRPSTTVRCPFLAVCFGRPAAADTTSSGRWDADRARFRCCCPRSSRNSTVRLGGPPSSAPSLQVQLGCRPSALCPPVPLLCSILWPPASLLCSTAVIVCEEPGFIHVFPRSTEPHLVHCF